MTAKVYIAGPMRGIKDFNFDAFYAAEREVHDLLGDCPYVEPFKPAGWYRNASEGTGECNITIFNPARRDHELYGPDVNKSETGDLADLPSFDLREALGADLNWIAREATHIYMLDGWENSSGARAEKALAEALGLTVLYQTEPVDELSMWKRFAEMNAQAHASAVDLAQAVYDHARISPATEKDWDEFWEDTTGVDTEAPVDYDAPLSASSLITMLDPYANAVRKADAMREEVRTVSSTGGEKGVKPARFDLIPAKPLWTVAELYGRGAEKYAERNWEKGYEWSKSYGAMLRHASLFWQGQDDDDETGLPHLASVVFHALAMMEWSQTHPEFDNRPKG